MSVSPLPLAITLMVVMVFLGCDRDHHYDKNEKTSSIRSFQRPADGKLTEQQVSDYILIRQKIITVIKAQKLAKKMTMTEYKQGKSSDFDFRHFDEIELTAANSINMSYEEFLWIKDKVITAQTQLLVQRYYDLNNRIIELLDQTLTRYKEINSEELEQQEQQTMNGYVAEMEQEITNLRAKITDPNERSAALKHNIILVSKFNNELEALQQRALQSFTP
jgi:hypothetical protein